MTKQITLEQALEHVTFKQNKTGNWYLLEVRCDVHGDIWGDVRGDVRGNVGGSVTGNVKGNVKRNVLGHVGGGVGGNVDGDVRGYVFGTIKGRKWTFMETPKDKLKRLIEEGADKDQLMEAFNQLENNS